MQFVILRDLSEKGVLHPRVTGNGCRISCPKYIIYTTQTSSFQCQIRSGFCSQAECVGKTEGRKVKKNTAQHSKSSRTENPGGPLIGLPCANCYEFNKQLPSEMCNAHGMPCFRSVSNELFDSLLQLCFSSKFNKKYTSFMERQHRHVTK